MPRRKVIDYLLPAEENEKELLSEAAKEKEPVELTTLGSTTESTVTDEVEEDEEVVVKEKMEEKEVGGRVVRIKNPLSKGQAPTLLSLSASPAECATAQQVSS